MTDTPNDGEEREVSLLRTGVDAHDARMATLMEQVRAFIETKDDDGKLPAEVIVGALFNVGMLFLAHGPRDQTAGLAQMMMLALASNHGRVVRVEAPPAPPLPKEKIN